ncbi:hypothetical protein MJ585_03225 [Klebsiella pneumoniae]|nr:hypothetical protein MJ585_03225 [Klebsiella pneumoniae]
MKAENATFGISFAAAAALAPSPPGISNTATKQNTVCALLMRRHQSINEGCNVLGFGFMDKEELGERLSKPGKRNTAHKYERAPPPRQGWQRRANHGPSPMP